MATLAEYQAAVEYQYDLLLGALVGGTADAYKIAICRIAHERMDAELKKSPNEVIAKWDFKATQQKVSLAGPTLWQSDWQQRADKELHPFVPTETDFVKKNNEYITAFRDRIKELNIKTHSSGHCDVNYFIEDNPLVNEVKAAFRQALQEWMVRQKFNSKFYQQSAIVGMATVLEERQDIVIALRAAQDMGAGNVTATPIDVALWKEALAFGVSCVPYLGEAVALLEAGEGRDLFCRKLSMEERVLTVVLIAITPLMKGARLGKRIFTAERTAAILGRGVK